MKMLWAIAISKVLSFFLQQVWLVSFVATVALDVVSGLIVGVVFSLMTLVYKVTDWQGYG